MAKKLVLMLFLFSAFTVDHKPVYPALGYRIQYKGCKIVISGDTTIVDSLAKNAKDADILINESFNPNLTFTGEGNYTEQQKKAIASYHSETLKLAQMAQEANAKRLYLTHFVPSISTNPSLKQEFIKGMDKYYSGPITPADDRDELVVESTGSDCKVTYIPAKPLNLPST